MPKHAIASPIPTARLKRRSGMWSIKRPKNGRVNALTSVAAA